MIANVLIVVSLVVTLLGVAGVREKSIQKRMIALTLATIGGLGIAFSQMGQYGLLSGLQQLPFRGIGLILLWLLMSGVCKKNQITTMEDLKGIRCYAPYAYGLMVVLAAFLIGIPGTGTFIGIMYAQMGYMYSYSGVLSYAGMLGNVVGMIVIAMIVLPMLREAFLIGLKGGKKQISAEIEENVRKDFVKPTVTLQVTVAVVVVAMIVLSVWQGAMTSVVTKIVDSIM